ncbi:phosphoglycerate kinase, partial [Thermodesulfovibrionales bacterium]|nr:phosphoglycerate kinase [Thermodesulfovibrionales bacterium]
MAKKNDMPSIGDQNIFGKLTIEDLQIKGKVVFIRADFNVPLDDNLAIIDDRRIRSALPTINYAIDEGAKVVLASHLGRPKGNVNLRLSLAPVAKRLHRLLNKEVIFSPECVGTQVETLVSNMKEGEVLLLENLRFHTEEEKNDESFARALAKLADFYINDAFGTAHRAHASIVGIPKFLSAAAGVLLKKEIEYLKGTVENPVRPFVVILGGAKVSGKIG